MKNFIQHGDILSLLAPYAVSSGGGFKVGQVFAVAVADAANGAAVEGKTTGVFELTKVGSQAWTVGALVYWDNTNKRCTTSGTGNMLIGAATTAVDNAAGSTLGIVRLNGIAQGDES